MAHYEMDALRARRAAQENARRRRRRWRRAGGLGLLLLVLAGAGVVLSATSSRSSRRRGHVASALGPATASRAAEARSAAAAAAKAAAPTPQQVAAATRFAALGRPLYCGGRAKRLVALTFDDGPGVYTRLAVKKLRQDHLRVTFFLVGKSIRGWPLVGLEKPLAAFGDHTMTHPFLPGLSQAAMVREISAAKSLIERTTGEPIVLFRPPYEGRTPAVDREARALGMVEVLWNVDSQDSLGANYAGIERNVVAGLRPGSIILMHENHGQTIRAMPTIFAALKRRHLQAVTVPELIAEDPPTPAQVRAGPAGCGITRRAGNGS